MNPQHNGSPIQQPMAVENGCEIHPDTASAPRPDAGLRQRCLHVEVLVSSDSRLLTSKPPSERLVRHVRDWLTHQPRGAIILGRPATGQLLSDKLLAEAVNEICVEDACATTQAADETEHADGARCLVDADTQLRLHVYCLEETGPEVEEIDDEAGLPAASQWLLPAREFHGLWPSLVYDGDVKRRLVNYVSATLLLSQRGVDSHVVAWNRVVLLHGPPGTGKTSLCKALAQKLSVRLRRRYAYTHLVEINSHSLFSKWFSESGKLVHKMFAKIHEMVEDSRALVVVLIDEVESLTAARRSASAASEPSDAIRVVNALLTQLDQIRRFSNVLILTTSNITTTIDVAFVDRADIKQLVPLPSAAAVYRILQSCVEELSRVGVLSASLDRLFPLYALRLTAFAENTATAASLRLWRVAQRAAGRLSGRALRKLPFLAVARLMEMRLEWQPTAESDGAGVGETAQAGVSLDDFVSALSGCVDVEFRERRQVDCPSGGAGEGSNNRMSAGDNASLDDRGATSVCSQCGSKTYC